MTKRIFRAINIATLVVFMATFTLFLSMFYDFFTSEKRSEVAAQAETIAVGVNREGLDYLEATNLKNFRITWVNAGSKVLFDNTADISTMDNHGDREEIKSAFETGKGESSRRSETVLKRQLYYALRLDDGTVIRVSSTQYTVLAFLIMLLRPIFILVLLAIILSFIFAKSLSKRIVRPLIAMDLDDPGSGGSYEELSPLLTRIRHQRGEIENQMAELAKKQEDFDIVTGSIAEGLILLNNEGIILSINKSAARFFDTDKSCIGRHMLTVNRDPDVQELLEKAIGGQKGEQLIAIGTREYQLSASPTGTPNQVTGVALIIFDITEKFNAEQMRREFTANVSHELKTPLHSISGCAELLLNDMVKPADIKQFNGQIYSEAQRMITLVDDIIRLSRLDEGEKGMSFEEIDLLELSKNTAAQLETQAAARHISITVSGEPVKIRGVAPMISGMIYNLTDNAIKYNREGGYVDIAVTQNETEAVIAVKDNGIGIPPEYQTRIFERFFRVDKSHSKEIGGTGLGLSIVKHSALLHHAQIELDSAAGRGTEIKIRFPKAEA